MKGKHKQKAKHSDEAEDKKLIKSMVGKAKIKMKKGGKVEGKKSKGRLDKPSRTAKAFKAGAGLGARTGAKMGAQMGAQAASGAMPQPPMAPPQEDEGVMGPMKRGGKVGAKKPNLKVKAGAGGGIGRLQKAKGIKRN